MNDILVIGGVLVILLVLSYILSKLPPVFGRSKKVKDIDDINIL